MQVYGHGQIWCQHSASWCICHVSMSNALPCCLPKIAVVSLVASCDLLGALGASAGCWRRVVSDVVSVHLSLPVPCQSAAVQRRRPCSAWANGLCPIFGGIWAPPLASLSEVHYICSSLVGKPRYFKWCTGQAGLRFGHCAMSHTRRSSPLHLILHWSRCAP